MKAPVVAQKDLTTLQDSYTSLGDRIRMEAELKRKMMEGFDYKYDKGQRVFTEDSAAKNKAPYEILFRTRTGNQVMREDHPTLGPGLGRPIIDPETGRARRTPYEPGYRVRSMSDEGEVYEFEIPASAIKGDVEMARGGKVYISSNPDTMRMELDERRMGGGGLLAKAIKGAQKGVLPAAEREANLAKFLEESKAPPTVYHSTSKDFNQFSAKKLGQNTKHPTAKLGFFTAENPASTEDFITSASGLSKGLYQPGANVMPLHLSIKNPYEIPSSQYLLQSMALQNMKKKDADKFVQDFIDSVKANGYDGLLIKANPRGLAKGNEFASDNWVAFEPTQIKSSIGNRGTYDITDPDINKAEGGAISADDLIIEERPL
jgi:hypothetical protein